MEGSLLGSGVSANWDEKMPLMFANMKWFIGEHQAYIMMIAAIVIAFTLLGFIVDLFNRKDQDKDNDDIEFL